MSYAMNRAIGAYQTAATTVAPPAAVTLLLDEVLNAFVLAAGHMRNNEHEDAFARVNRASGILRGLRQNVDLEYDLEMGHQLVDMYTRNIFAINMAYPAADAIEQFADLAEGLLEFRNSWAEMTTLAPRGLETLRNDILTERSVVDGLALVDTA